HFAAEAVQAAAGLPLVHIAVETARAVRERLPRVRRLGVLGTSNALRADFFTHAFSQGEGFELILPQEQERIELDALIFGELASGQASAASAAVVTRIAGSLVS